jgi:phosphate transport system substrate-binding protein
MQADRMNRKTEKVQIVLRSIVLPAFAFLLPLLLMLPPKTQASEYLTVSGCSVSNVGYLSELAKEYERRFGVKVFVRGGGSVVGIEDLRNGKVDLAASCRGKEDGDPGDITYVQVAWDALAFIVHKTNPAESVSLDNVRSIYSGDTTDWKQLGGQSSPIKIFISRAKQGLSGVEASTKKLVLNGMEPKETQNTLFVASTGIVEQMVEETPEGFATTGVTSARKRNVKILKVNGVAPTNAAIIKNKYPLKRPLYLLLPKSPKPETKRFVDFLLSKAGQQFLRSQNVISLLDIK